MRRFIYVITVFWLMGVQATWANYVAPPSPSLDAKSWVLLDYNAGSILSEHTPDERVGPASLTKLMTVYIAFKALKEGSITLDQSAHVSNKAWKMGGSRMFIQPDKDVTVDQLLHGIIIDSGNDACVALAELIAGTEDDYVYLMNQEAEKMGLKNTHFMNVTGLPDPEHYSSANDIAIIAKHVIADFPAEYAKYYSQKEYTYNKIRQPNRNRLLWMDPSVDGMKTGHTDAAGYCLVTSANRSGHRLISVILGTDSDNKRVQESLKLLNFGYRFFDVIKPFSANQVVKELRVWKGKDNQVAVGFEQDLMVSIPKNYADKLIYTIKNKDPLMAPIKRGDQVGELIISMDNQVMHQYPLVALNDVDSAGFISRLWDALKLWFKNLFGGK